MEPTIRTELAELTTQARGLAELDQLLGIAHTPVPTLPPLKAPPQPQRELPRAAPAPAIEVVSAPPPPPPPPADASLAARRQANEAKLHALANRMQGCTQCRLSEGRTKLVFGQGDAAAEVVFVGEGPGYHEDQQGLAFVGRAGELLTKMISAMGIDREEAFIANVVKCRPPGNRNPGPDEMGTCLPFLREQLEIIQPRVICSMGKTAAIGLGLLEPGGSIGRNRGKFKDWHGIPTMLTYHPAYLLRTPQDKRKTWNDLQKMFPFMERRRPGPPKTRK